MDDTYKNWVTIPRDIFTDCREGRISIPERNLLTFLRCCGNPYGMATVSFEQLSKETFNKEVKVNYINKLLLSLKRKKYITYTDRQGRRGSFDIHLDKWILPDKTIKRLGHITDTPLIRSSTTTPPPKQSEVRPEVDSPSQKSIQPKTGLSKEERFHSIRKLVRSYDTNTDNEKKTDIQSVHLSSNDNRIPIEGFKVNSLEEHRLLEIAIAVGESEMGFFINVYKKLGLSPIERAFEEFRLKNRHEMKNPPAYFNSLVQKHLM